MELNNQNKAKFFAQYWGQKVGSTKNGFSHLTLNKSCFLNIDYLNLKPVSSIKDEDLEAIQFSFIKECPPKININPDNYKYHWITLFGQEGHFALKDFDYLRSKGYALPWMGLSVEEMVQAGWIKLQEVKNG